MTPAAWLRELRAGRVTACAGETVRHMMRHGANERLSKLRNSAQHRSATTIYPNYLSGSVLHLQGLKCGTPHHLPPQHSKNISKRRFPNKFTSRIYHQVFTNFDKWRRASKLSTLSKRQRKKPKTWEKTNCQLGLIHFGIDGLRLLIHPGNRLFFFPSKTFPSL